MRLACSRRAACPRGGGDRSPRRLSPPGGCLGPTLAAGPRSLPGGPPRRGPRTLLARPRGRSRGRLPPSSPSSSTPTCPTTSRPWRGPGPPGSGATSAAALRPSTEPGIAVVAAPAGPAGLRGRDPRTGLTDSELSPHWPPGVTARRRRDLSAIGAGAARVLHLLTNSLPWTQSGYALRSHAILRAQAARGHDRGGGDAPRLPRDGGRAVGRRASTSWTASPTAASSRRGSRPTPEDRLVQTAELLARPRRPLRRRTCCTRRPTTPTPSSPAPLRRPPGARGSTRPGASSRRPGWPHVRRTSARRRRAASASPSGTPGRPSWPLAADHVVVLSEVMRDDLVARGSRPTERHRRAERRRRRAARPRAGLLARARPRARLGLPRGRALGRAPSPPSSTTKGSTTSCAPSPSCGRRGRDVRCALVGRRHRPPGARGAGRDPGHRPTPSVLPGRVPRAQAPRLAPRPRRLRRPPARHRGDPVGHPAQADRGDGGRSPGRGQRPPGARRDRRRTGHRACWPRRTTPPRWRIDSGSCHDDEDLRRALGAAGREFAATRTWRAMAGRYDSIYGLLGRTT